LPGCEGVKRFNTHSRKVKQTYERLVNTSVLGAARGLTGSVSQCWRRDLRLAG
jgi:hypothetical protein